MEVDAKGIRPRRVNAALGPAELTGWAHCQRAACEGELTVGSAGESGLTPADSQ